ncbi:MAG TPA: hypothetical protein VGG89_02575 [Candidatus Baltobacteraceae bacterium]
MSMRPCILHIGTHKTGTTSLQIAFQENLDALHGSGIHFVQSGWHGDLPGNAELAWELVGERSETLLALLVEELRANPYRTALLSAEDFSLLHARPRALEKLAGAVRSAGYDPHVLVYLRAQGAFAESMYVERVKQGHIRPIQSYLDTIVRTGCYVPEGTVQAIQFQYTRLLEPFAAAFGRDHMHVRIFTGSGEPSLIFKDFLGALSLLDAQFARDGLKLQLKHPRENASLPFVELLGTLHVMLRPGEPLPDDAMEFIGIHAPEVSEADAVARFALFDREEHLRLLRSFASDNAQIAAEYGASIPFVSENDVRPADDPYWTRAGALRAAFDRCLRLWSTESAGGPQMSSAAAGQTETT